MVVDANFLSVSSGTLRNYLQLQDRSSPTDGHERDGYMGTPRRYGGVKESVDDFLHNRDKLLVAYSVNRFWKLCIYMYILLSTFPNGMSTGDYSVLTLIMPGEMHVKRWELTF